MKKFILILTLLTGIGVNTISAQNIYFTKTGQVNFYSSTPMENIEANNNKVTSIMDISSGNIEFSALIMAFQFQKALMQEHFNENYMESEKFPKATFKGKITNLDKINFKADGTYPAEVTGKMTMHGVTRDINTTGVFTVKGGKISMKSTFNVAPSDYEIEIPGVVKEKIAKEIKVEVQNNYELYSK